MTVSVGREEAEHSYGEHNCKGSIRQKSAITEQKLAVNQCRLATAVYFHCVSSNTLFYIMITMVVLKTGGKFLEH